MHTDMSFVPLKKFKTQHAYINFLFSQPHLEEHSNRPISYVSYCLFLKTSIEYEGIKLYYFNY